MDCLASSQIRGARAMLDWSMIDLARAAGVSVSVVKRIEDGTPAIPTTMVERLRTVLESSGVAFLSDDGTGLGVMLRSREPSPIARFF